MANGGYEYFKRFSKFVIVCLETHLKAEITVETHTIQFVLTDCESRFYSFDEWRHNIDTMCNMCIFKCRLWRDDH